jgi:hypothetical protein
VVTPPTASNLNFGANQTVPNLVIVRVPPSGIVKLFNKLGSVHLIADVFGYYDNDESTEAGRVIPLFPGRAFDTRGGPPLGPGSTLTLNFENFNGGVRNSQASGYVMNTTITEPSAQGFLTVYPFGSARPLVSNLNFLAGQTIPNLVMVAIGGTDPCRIGFFNSPTGTTHLLSDLFGVITNDLLTPPSACPVLPPVFTGSIEESPSPSFDVGTVEPANF